MANRFPAKALAEQYFNQLKSNGHTVPRNEKTGEVLTSFGVGKEYKVHAAGKPEETLIVRCTQDCPTHLKVMHIGYVITGKKKSGLREMVSANNPLSIYSTKEAAEAQLQAIHTNNNPETIEQLMGTNLRVDITTRWTEDGDSTRTVFPD